MSSPCRNPERRAVIARLLPVATAAMFAVAVDNAAAQHDTAPSAGRGPNNVSVTSLFPNGSAPLPLSPDAIGRRFEGNKLAMADGEQLFGQMNCTGCHFNGGGGMGPALMSGHWRYGGRIEQVYESIAQGRPNGMPSWQFVLGPTQIWDLAAYVQSLPALAPSSASSTTAARGSVVKP
jgi:cytochrome c oxidase cbb3-type subunit III